MQRKHTILYASIMATLLTTTMATMPLYAADITNQTKTVTSDVTTDVYGGQGTEEGDNASDDHVTITAPGSVTGRVYGGYTLGGGTANGNTVELDKAAVKTGLDEAALGIDGDAEKYTGSVYGGYISLDASGDVTPASEASNNTVTLKDSTVGGLYIAGGYIKKIVNELGVGLDANTYTKPSDANNNTVTITYDLADPVEYHRIWGGYTPYGDANGNTVSLEGTLSGSGENAKANVTVQSMAFNSHRGSDAYAPIYGGSTDNGNANENTLSLKRVAINDDITGGFGEAGLMNSDGRASASANNNKVYLEDVYMAGLTDYNVHYSDGSYNTHSAGVNSGYSFVSITIESDNLGAQFFGEANDNTAILIGSAATPQLACVDYVYGGYADSNIYFDSAPEDSTITRTYTEAFSANNNTVSLNHYQANEVVGGAAFAVIYDDAESKNDSFSTTATAKNNQVFLTDSIVTGNVLGGSSVSYYDSDIAGAYRLMDHAVDNTVILSGSTVTGYSSEKLFTVGDIVGGFALQGTAAGNTVTLQKNSNAYGVYGGAAGFGTATGNTVNLTESTVTNAYGGVTGLESSLYNSVGWSVPMISSTEDFSSTVTDPTVSTSKANDNTVNMLSGTADSLWGGYAQKFGMDKKKFESDGKGGWLTITTTTNYVSGSANNNTVNYYSGTVNKSIIGGQSDSAAADNNTVNLYAALVGENLNLYGGVGQTESTGNTLNVYAKGNSVANLDHFQNYNFYVPAGTAAGDTVLTVTGTADLTDATVKAGVEETTNLSEGQVINLIYDAKGLTTDGTTYAMMDGKDTVTDAGFLQRKASIWKQDDNTIVIGILKNTTATLNADTKLFAEDRAAAVNLVNTGSDFAATSAYDGALTAWNGDKAVKGDFTPYFVVGGHDLRADTGSYVDTYGLNANLGFVKRTDQKGHTDTLMPFLEYGNGNYTSHLDDGARGDGDQRYIGAGLLARRDLTNGLHYEAMLRAGRTNGDFHGQIDTHLTSYDTSAPYLSAMLGAGKVVKKDTTSIDYYGKVFWTHLGSDSVQVHSDLGTSQYDFDSVDSYRTRLGFRWTKNVSPTTSYYAGLAWNYEFGDNAEARYGTFETPAAGVKGHSALLELGWQSKIDKDHAWGADLHVTGWTGVQRGVTYSATVSRAF